MNTKFLCLHVKFFDILGFLYRVYLIMLNKECETSTSNIRTSCKTEWWYQSVYKEILLLFSGIFIFFWGGANGWKFPGLFLNSGFSHSRKPSFFYIKLNEKWQNSEFKKKFNFLLCGQRGGYFFYMIFCFSSNVLFL